MVHIFYVLVIQNLFKNIFKDEKMRLNSCKLAASSVALGLGMAETTPIVPAEDTGKGSLETRGSNARDFTELLYPAREPL
jgi:hypothetical protein